MILASASPRRREILTGLGVAFEAVVPDVQELTVGEPAEVVVENARRKALAGARDVRARDGDLVLGVDTEVVLDGRALGKAAGEPDARERLEALSGRTHEVLSGVAVVDGAALRSPQTPQILAGRAVRAGLARSQVTFKALGEEAIARYLRSGEWRDRAGAYAIQGLGSTLIESLHGDFSNVVGLPIETLQELVPELFA